VGRRLRALEAVTENAACRTILFARSTHRFAYCSLNHLQVELLRRWRWPSRCSAARILISINGIAAGLRNTG
jgi:phosphoenolpyruvate carboxylase